MLVATAGHIDHGKTALVRAITGEETDRLPEERARGMTIDLGFAYWRPDAGDPIGFIDVPGHERYVRNMLAGASGAEFALLAVAADDGVMPQTLEHLRMLDLLGFARGLVAITKCDRADGERIAGLRDAIADLVTGTGMEGAPIHAVSAVTGAGMDGLKAALVAARDARPDPCDEGRGFRLAIDRAFTVTGAGTVVTGTVMAGAATTGDSLVLSPLGRTLRVRGLQSAGRPTERISAGQRGALNLSGIEVGEVHRGDWLVAPDLHAPTQRLEARLGVIAACDAPLRHDARVHLHIGTADLGARVLIPGQHAIAPGDCAVVQLVLDAPTSALVGQRFVLRDASGRVLIGGGRMLDPLAAPRRRAPAVREATAAALALPEPSQALYALAAIAGHEVDAGWFVRAFGLRSAEARPLVAAGDVIALGSCGRILIAKSRFAALGEALVAAIGKHHADEPASGGMTRRAARLALGEPVSTELFTALVERLAAAGQIEADRALLRLPGFRPEFDRAETALWRALIALCEAPQPRPLAIAELARELRTGEPAVRAMLYRRRLAGDIWQVSDTRYMLREHVAALVATAAHLDAGGNGFTAAQFRDATGLGRNFVIELLEFLDRIGATRRMGEVRRMRPDHTAIAGAARPWLVPR